MEVSNQLETCAFILIPSVTRKGLGTDYSNKTHDTPTTFRMHDVCLLGAIMECPAMCLCIGPLGLSLNSLENITLKKHVFMVSSVRLIRFSLPNFVRSRLITIFNNPQLLQSLAYVVQSSTPAFSNIAKLVVWCFLAMKAFSCYISWAVRFVIVALFEVSGWVSVNCLSFVYGDHA